MIVIDQLKKRYPGNADTALDGLSLRIEPGSFFTLFGPSGCGKSTLLRCIAGLETPDTGEIEIGGEVVFSAKSGVFVPPNKRRLGMVFQSYAIWPHMTVFENVAFPLSVQGLPDIKERTRAVLNAVGLGSWENQYASRLSGGQQQRVALARAIVADPVVLLLDEPLSNLDATLRNQMQAELMSLQKRFRVTTVYVTHDQNEALSMSDRIAVMNHGRFVEINSPRELYDHPRSAFTAGMVGAANLLEALVIPAEGALTRLETPFGIWSSTDPGRGAVQAFVRPEKIRLTPIADEHRDVPFNVISCCVVARRFAGDSTELDLAASSAPDAPTLRCRAPSSHGISVGEQVQVFVNAADVRILAPS
jgi:iron(III) transport system ATP-binding protein